MNSSLSYSQSTFGNIYSHALEIQLQTIGNNLHALRQARNEDPGLVAKSINLSIEELESIENGACDFKLHVLFDLCNYYEIDLEEMVKQSGMMRLKIA